MDVSVWALDMLERINNHITEKIVYFEKEPALIHYRTVCMLIKGKGETNCY